MREARDDVGHMTDKRHLANADRHRRKRHRVPEAVIRAMARKRYVPRLALGRHQQPVC
jgi:hypothetical protein